MKVRSEIPTAENTTNMDGFGTCEVGTTLDNLKAAIGGETGASAKYAAFAKAAKEQGYDQIARLFEATSAAEQIHIGLEYALVAEMEPGFEKPAAPEAEGVQTDLNLIVKADVQGSIEALRDAFEKMDQSEVRINIVHSAVGGITETDVTLASASDAIIIGFNVRPTGKSKQQAEKEKVDIRLYRIIYQAIEDVEAAMKGMLDPIYEEQVTGHAVVRQTFKASGVGTIAGSYVLDGKITRGSKARITREGEQIFEGPLASLKRFKDDVKEVNAGYECGLVFEGFNDLKEDDMIEIYIMVEVPR